MSQKWIRPIVLAAIVLETIFFGSIRTKSFSAYGACRSAAMITKGYAVWKYEGTHQMVFMSLVVFHDGYNYFGCEAVGVGPFWVVLPFTGTTMAGCFAKRDGSPCRQDYYGVGP